MSVRFCPHILQAQGTNSMQQNEKSGSQGLFATLKSRERGNDSTQSSSNSNSQHDSQQREERRKARAKVLQGDGEETAESQEDAHQSGSGSDCDSSNDSANDSQEDDKLRTRCLFAVGDEAGVLSIWSTHASRPLFIIKDVFTNSISDISWTRGTADDSRPLIVACCSTDGRVLLAQLDDDEADLLSDDEAIRHLQAVYADKSEGVTVPSVKKPIVRPVNPMTTRPVVAASNVHDNSCGSVSQRSDGKKRLRPVQLQDDRMHGLVGFGTVDNNVSSNSTNPDNSVRTAPQINNAPVLQQRKKQRPLDPVGVALKNNTSSSGNKAPGNPAGFSRIFGASKPFNVPNSSTKMQGKSKPVRNQAQSFYDDDGGGGGDFIHANDLSVVASKSIVSTSACKDNVGSTFVPASTGRAITAPMGMPPDTVPVHLSTLSTLQRKAEELEEIIRTGGVNRSTTIHQRAAIADNQESDAESNMKIGRSVMATVRMQADANAGGRSCRVRAVVAQRPSELNYLQYSGCDVVSIVSLLVDEASSPGLDSNESDMELVDAVDKSNAEPKPTTSWTTVLADAATAVCAVCNDVQGRGLCVMGSSSGITLLDARNGTALTGALLVGCAVRSVDACCTSHASYLVLAVTCDHCLHLWRFVDGVARYLFQTSLKTPLASLRSLTQQQRLRSVDCVCFDAYENVLLQVDLNRLVAKTDSDSNNRSSNGSVLQHGREQQFVFRLDVQGQSWTRVTDLKYLLSRFVPVCACSISALAVA